LFRRERNQVSARCRRVPGLLGQAGSGEVQRSQSRIKGDGFVEGGQSCGRLPRGSGESGTRQESVERARPGPRPEDHDHQTRAQGDRQLAVRKSDRR
jgi:hypothetical protein